MIISAFADEAGKTIEEQTDALMRNGLGYIDVRAVNGVNIADMSYADCEAYLHYFTAHGIKVNCIASPIGKSDLGADAEKEERRFADIVRKAKIFNTDKIRIFSFYHSNGNVKEVCRRLSGWVEYAAAQNISLYHENELGIYGERARETAELADKVPGLKLLYDPANFVLVGQNIEEAERLILNRTDFFHVKDATYSGAIVPAGEGDGRIKEALQICSPAYVTLEPHLIEFDGYGNIDKRKIRSKYDFSTAAEAFDAAIAAFKKITGGQNQ